MKPLLRSCVEVHEPIKLSFCAAIELSFGMMSGVAPGIHVLDGGPRASREGAVLGIFRRLRPHWFEWAE